MKKGIFIAIFIVLLAIAGGAYYVLTNLDSIIKAAIEKYGSQATQTAVRVDSVRIKLTEGDGTISGLRVANPGGFEQKQAISLGEIGLGIDIKSLQQEPYVINRITVKAPKINVEINNDKKTNLNELKKNLMQGAGATNSTATSDKQKGAEPRLIIKNITFADGSIHAKVTPLNKEYDLKLPSLVMSNLGGSKGATPTELAKEILQRLTDQAKDEIKKKGIDAELDKLKAKANEKIDAEKAKLKEKADAEKAKADTKLDAEKAKAQDKLKNLLNR